MAGAPGQIFEEVVESTEGGSCSSPRKEEAAPVHGRRNLLKSTEGERCSNPQKEEAARVHGRRKRLESTDRLEEATRVHRVGSWNPQ